jgi:uncharacterized protein (DUF362 family)/Pyruvate/2-oxoacid:ferredoxin oxidoreductase delta subunit
MPQTPQREEAPVSPARVAVVRCDTYDPAAVDAAVARGLELVGGASRFAAAGERIVLKPNLLVPSVPEKAVTTHPTVFSAVARALAAEGATLTWGDSPGFGGGEAAGRKAGLAEVASALSIAFGDFTHGRDVSFPDGALIKRFTLVEAVASADGLVSLPKLKTHALTRMTGAIKNQFGCVPGMLKGEFHAKMPDVERFSTMLVDLNRLIRPRLFVMDAIVGMHGNGPRNGDPLQIGALLFSVDPVALDAVGCRIFGLDPSLVETIVIGDRLGLGNITEIELVGDELPERHDAVVNRSHASTTGKGLGSPRLRNLLAPRPYIVHERCTRCGTCVAVCPVEPKAVQFPEGDKARVPEHTYERCIRCYCCQEMCPERAIEVKTPPLGRIIRR